jgi:hypothetical protein
MYMDGVCDCECGKWDPDCEPNSMSVAAINNGSSALSILDAMQTKAVMNFLDKDRNANGIIDGMEVNSIQTFGISALYGVAMRILRAQEQESGSTKGPYRKGNFANLQAEPSSSCNYLLANPPFPTGAATYTPVCIKDSVWDPRLGEPTGRCGLLPVMKIGSQCTVPSDGTPASQAGWNGSTPTSKGVCGSLMQIFPAGGVGGLFSAGVGKTSADLYNKGGTFMHGVDTGNSELMTKLDLTDTMKLDTSFKDGFSFYARVKFNTLQRHSKIFAFGDPSRHNTKNRIVVGIGEVHDNDMSDSADLHFLVQNRDSAGGSRRRGSTSHMKIGKAEKPFIKGTENQFLFTWKPGKTDGQIMIFRNGVKLLEARSEVKMTEGNFKTLVIGHTNNNDHNVHGFDGDIKDIRIWSRPVTWDLAVSGSIPGETSPDNDKEQQGEVETKCIPSKMNSWDFVCGDELPPAISEEFGYGSVSDSKAQEAFKIRERLGDVSPCGQKISAKAVMYQGKFGDGLTAEYFAMKTDCNVPPFLFGRMPSKVRTDPQPKFTGKEFHAASNQLAIRWTGKLLIGTSGSYVFKLLADDGAWLAIDGAKLVWVDRCGHRDRTTRDKEAPKELEKGAHDISILYFNKGPAGSGHPGKFELKYNGPDTGGIMTEVPTSNLGSAPLRLAKLAKELGKSGNKTKVVDVMPGAFVYDDEHHVGIMPKGSCDFNCKKGKRKESGAYYKFYCPSSVKGSFVAKVNAQSKLALMWLDAQPGQMWKLSTQAGPGAQPLSLSEDTLSSEQILASSLGIDSFKLNDDPGPMRASNPSPVVDVNAGEHTLVIQGMMEETEMFALGDLQLEGGLSQCSFFLEGRDKSRQDC